MSTTKKHTTFTNPGRDINKSLIKEYSQIIFFRAKKIKKFHQLFKGGAKSPADWYIFSERYMKEKKCENIFFLQLKCSLLRTFIFLIS